MVNFMARFKDHTLTALRVMAGFMFMLHGAQKLFGFLMREGGSTATLFSLKGFAGVLEFFGGIAILLGLFTPVVAFVLSGQMAVAYFMSHFPRSFWPTVNRGEVAVLYCFVFLFLATSGGGKWSLDQLLGKKSKNP